MTAVATQRPLFTHGHLDPEGRLSLKAIQLRVGTEAQFGGATPVVPLLGQPIVVIADDGVTITKIATGDGVTAALDLPDDRSIEPKLVTVQDENLAVDLSDGRDVNLFIYTISGTATVTITAPGRRGQRLFIQTIAEGGLVTVQAIGGNYLVELLSGNSLVSPGAYFKRAKDGIIPGFAQTCLTAWYTSGGLSWVETLTKGSLWSDS